MKISGQDGYFDDVTVVAMVIAYDRACSSLRSCATNSVVREIIAQRIIQVAKQGERDADHLHQQALQAFGMEEVPKVIAA